MSRLLKSRDYLMNYLGLLLLLGFISLGAIGGCNNGNGNGNLNGDGLTSGDRTITFINNCSETIWVGSQNLDISSTGWELIGSSEGCTSDADCQKGLTTTATCNNGNCQQVVSVPATCISCQAWARTGCDFNSDTGLCDGVGGSKFNCCATGGCTVSGGEWGLQCLSGAQAPNTLVEFTLQQQPNNDFYDVSIIGGMNVPAEIKPAGSTAALPTNFDRDYWCGNPGSLMSDTDKTLDCPWVQLSDSENKCNSYPELRVVNPTLVTSSSDCMSTAQFKSIAGVGNVCTCSDSNDGNCNNGEICGVGNNQIVGDQVCGKFAGCTTPDALCGLYFPMTNHPNLGDELVSCNTILSGTPSCKTNSDCPQLVGIIFTDQSTCESNCPTGTECIQTSEDPKFGCQMKCENNLCQSGDCSSDSDCLTLPNGTATGTFMLCDTSSNMCVSTIASLFSTTGINGQSCYNPSGSFNNKKFNAATTFCAGCPTNCENPPCAPWPLPSKECTTTAEGAGSSCGSVQCSNPDWERDAQPITSAFKEACPAAYSFPFDDPTSTFQCTGTGSTNTLGYDITFCPSQ